MGSRVSAVDYYLPPNILTNDALAEEFPEWSVEKIEGKTGIRSRHVVREGEYTSELAVRAAEQLLSSASIDRSSVEYLIVCTQTPDYILPSVAGIVQTQLGLPTAVGATDINLGCSGYVYALGLAKGLIESEQVSNVLVITSDTYTRVLNKGDKSVRTIFGDGAAATFVESVGGASRINGVVYGTDGSGAKSLIVPSGGLRDGREIQPKSDAEARGLVAGDHDLFMDGPAIFNFTLATVPAAVDGVLSKAGLGRDDIDLFVFHQANAFMLDHLRKKLGVPKDRFFVSMQDSGNTVSSTIPIALTDAVRQGVLDAGMKVMIVGFGVGLSWGGLVIDW
ncbi:ketoacyl-ACP synthase III [Microbacterium pseudoresistens]|uniref:3-oxoacyl-[acyl-carrier-protein] synthase-3 n=1 Tax=Microbacterium pseudoresistens TaxID=640634 RepID=A0A7Y9EVC0_9MICO|nr:ketoacyl-ACP synthase III [Microbacterium pseudoresistens]NYD54588.1 3-oxoacyl-[acyl-carrier-protein] synthase-3 [Microbacterium pseudoresistens]